MERAQVGGDLILRGRSRHGARGAALCVLCCVCSWVTLGSTPRAGVAAGWSAPPRWDGTTVEFWAGPTFHDGGEDAFEGGVHAGLAVRRAMGSHLVAAVILEQHELRFAPREYPPWVPLTRDSYLGDQRILTLSLEARWRLGTSRDRLRAFGSAGAGVAWPEPLEAVYVQTRADRFTGAVLRAENRFFGVGDPRAMGTIGGGVECMLGGLDLTAGVRLFSDAAGDIRLNDLFLAVGARPDPVEEVGQSTGGGTMAPPLHAPYWVAWGGPATHMASEDLYQEGHAWGVSLRVPVHARGTVGVELEHAEFAFDSTHWVSPNPERTATVSSADPRTLNLATLDGMIYTAGPTRALRPFCAAGLGLGRTNSASVAYTLSEPEIPDIPPLPDPSGLVLLEPDTYGVVSAAAGLEWRVGPLRTFARVRYRRSVGGDLEIRDAAVGIGY